MPTPRSRTLLALLLLVLGAAGCSDPIGVTPDRLVFIRAAADAPELATQAVSFWAVRGENREVEIRYVPLPGAAEGERCLRFRVDARSLHTRPDGSRFADGDSVRITIRVVDYSQFHFEFTPSGLRFDPERPAELRVSYAFADPDFNADGLVDDRDATFEFGFWRQEAPGRRWTSIGSARIHDLEEVRADIRGFTRYAMAGAH